MANRCQSTRDLLAAYMLDTLVSDQLEGACVITLPIPTVDGRLVSVFIDQRVGDSFRVHDGGKAVDELVMQGVKITESISDHFTQLAKRLRIAYSDEMFQFVGKERDLQAAILAVGTCSGLAMAQLVGHIAPVMEEPTRDKFGHALRSWGKKKVKVTKDVPVKGRRADHRFDFVAAPKDGKRDPIAMSVLSPGSNPLAAAQRFGFKATDLDSTRYEKWPRVAIEDRAELWTPEAKNIVRNCATVVIEVPSGSKIGPQMVEATIGTLLGKAS